MNNRLNISARLALLLVPVLLVVGCASDNSMQRYVPQIVTPYRIDIQQGNFVTQDMVDKLAVGQTRDQVRFILGTPLLTDVFHANRWDYVFRHSRGWNEPERRRLVIYFDADSRVTRWESDVPAAPPAPAAAEAPAKPAPAAPATPPASVPATSGAAGDAAAANTANVASAPPANAAAVLPVREGTPQANTAGVTNPSAAVSAPATAPTPTPVAEVKADTAPNSPGAAAPSAAPGKVEPPAALADIDRKLADAPASAAAANSAPRDVLATLEEWRAAWSARDVDKYLSMYAPTFKPVAGLSRSKWEQQRRERLKRASFIVVKVVDPQVTVAGSDAAAIFTQVYESDTLKESGRKKLALMLLGSGKWRIREETFEK